MAFAKQLVEQVGTQAGLPGFGNAMAQLMPADDTHATPYYGLYTNDGDLNGAVWANPGQEVRLVDPRTGQVLASGKGPEGAQQIATLANSLSHDLGRKAQWQVQLQQGETPGGQDFSTVGYDRYDPKRVSLLGKILRIAGPILGAAFPGIAPLLGAALGGMGATAATGGNLKESLFAGVSSGLGNVAGGALSSVLRGAPISWGGVNPMAGMGSQLSGGMDKLLGGIGTDAITTGAGNMVAPVTVMGSLGPGALGSVLSGAGAGLGGVATGLGGGGGGSNPTSQTGQQPTDLSELVVSGTRPGGMGPIPGLWPTGADALHDEVLMGDAGIGAPQNKPPGLLDPLDLVGNTAGGLGADFMTGALAQLLGFGPGGNKMKDVADGGYGDAVNPGGAKGPMPPKVPTDGMLPWGPPKTTPVAGTPGAGGGAGLPGGGGLANDAPAGLPGASGGGGGAPSPFNAAPDFAAPSAATEGGGFDAQGSFAPDIYPWRKARMA